MPVIRQRGLALAVALALFLAPRRAEMGQIHYDEVSLDELLAACPTIVVAKPASPSVPKTLDLGEGVEPYGYAESAWTVVESLRPPRPAHPGETLVVTGFDGDSLSLHVAYYAHGMSRSPIWPLYSAAHSPADLTEPTILFLRRAAFLMFDPATGTLEGRADTYALVVHGAMEGMGARAALAPQAAQAPGCVDRLDLTIGAPGVTEPMRERISEAIHARFPDEGSIGWTMVDTRPSSGMGHP